MSKGHYKRQLDRVDTKGQFAPTFQFKSMGGDTQWMNLNQESAEELMDWLMEHYPRTMMKLEDVKDKKSFDCPSCPDFKTEEHCKDCDAYPKKVSRTITKNKQSIFDGDYPLRYE